MKEKLDYFCNSFKNGIILWIISYLLLYAVGVHIGDVSAYNAEILKLLDVKNYILQILIAGISYAALDFSFTYYFNNIIKILELNVKSKKELLKDVVILIIVFSVVLSFLEIVKELDIINRNIIKLMFFLMIMKTIIFCTAQMVKTEIYNQKLQEKNKK